MRKLILLLAIYGLSGVVYAQTDNIPSQITDQGVSDAKQIIDQDTIIIAQKTANMQNVNAEMNSTTSVDNAIMQDDQSIISKLQTGIQMRQGGVLALAGQTPPIQSAVDLCNSNPAVYCPGWVIPAPLLPVNTDTSTSTSTDTSGVNWEANP